MQILLYIILLLKLSYSDFISFLLTYNFLCLIFNYNFIIFPNLNSLVYSLSYNLFYHLNKTKYIKNNKFKKIINFYIELKNCRNKKYKQLNLNLSLESDKDIDLFLNKITNKNISQYNIND